MPEIFRERANAQRKILPFSITYLTAFSNYSFKIFLFIRYFTSPTDRASPFLKWTNVGAIPNQVEGIFIRRLLFPALREGES